MWGDRKTADNEKDSLMNIRVQLLYQFLNPPMEYALIDDA